MSPDRKEQRTGCIGQTISLGCISIVVVGIFVVLAGREAVKIGHDARNASRQSPISAPAKLPRSIQGLNASDIASRLPATFKAKRDVVSKAKAEANGLDPFSLTMKHELQEGADKRVFMTGADESSIRIIEVSIFVRPNLKLRPRTLIEEPINAVLGALSLGDDVNAEILKQIRTGANEWTKEIDSMTIRVWNNPASSSVTFVVE